MLKKIIISVVLSLSLVSCGDSTTVENTESIQSVFENLNFSISLPTNWNIIKDTDNILPKPANGEVVFDAVSDTQNDSLYRNILVLKQELSSDISSLDFIIGNYIGSKKEYFYIKDLAEKDIIIDNKNTKIYEFEARYSEDTPIINFLQTGIVCNKNGYLITIAIEKSNPNIERYEGLLTTFECKAITESLSTGEK